MHPELVGALARQRTKELLRQAEFRDTDGHATWLPAPGGNTMVRRVRWRLGGVLLDVGLHLMAAT